MSAITYRMELDAEKHPVLVKENEILYDRPITEPSYIVELCDKLVRLRFLAEEHVVMVAVDTKGCLLGVFNISHGSIDMSICNPREIYMRAMLVGASRIFVVHNHPSDDCTPSKDDLNCARKLAHVGEIMGIKLNDFIIVGRDSYYSSKSNGTL